MATMSSNRETFTAKPVDSSKAPTGYESQWLSNPYANFDYHHTWWQKLLEGFGIRTDFNKYQESLNMNAKEYEAQLLEKAHNEQYDSASAQAARMRAAGINPDLQGGVDAGGSSGMEPDPSMPVAPGDDNGVFSRAASVFANTVLTGFSTAVGLAGNFMQLSQMKNDVEAGRISNSDALLRQAMSFVLGNIPSSYQHNDKEGADIFHNGYFQDQAEYWLQDSGYTKRQRNQFLRNVRNYASSAPASVEAYEAWLKQGKTRIENATMRSSDLFSDWDSVLFTLVKPISRANDRLRKAASSLEAKSAENQLQYQEQIDPALSAEVENATNQRNLHGADIDGILNEALDEVIGSLRDLSESNKRGHNAASIALVVFSLLRMVNFSKSFGNAGNVDFSRTSVGF